MLLNLNISSGKLKTLKSFNTLSCPFHINLVSSAGSFWWVSCCIKTLSVNFAAIVDFQNVGTPFGSIFFLSSIFLCFIIQNGGQTFCTDSQGSVLCDTSSESYRALLSYGNVWFCLRVFFFIFYKLILQKFPSFEFGHFCECNGHLASKMPF